MKVKDVMTTPVICVSVDASTAEVAALLATKKISAAPVLDGDGSVVGLVSEYDLLAKSGKTAREIMSPGVISVNEEADVEDVRFLIVERRVRRVPVVSGRQLVGIVSRSDLIRQMAMQWYCDLCGEPVRGEHPPDRCPKCTAPAGRFTHAQHLPID